MNRRKFLLNAGLLTPTFLHAKNWQLLEDNKFVPTIISTWKPNVKANEKAWEIISKGGYALDAIHEGVKTVEADPNDNSVGLGGLPDRDGNVTLDACIMDNHGNIGSVMALEHIVHASSIARLIMEKTPHVQIVGAGALQLALQEGFKKENLLTPSSKEKWEKWKITSKYNPINTVEEIQERIKNNHDTIGMLGLDNEGRICGICTTSGLAYKMRGRVGDSPIIGAGLYVDSEVGAATATGMGEEVVRICGSHTVVESMRYGATPESACKTALERLIRMKGEAYCKNVQIGFIAMNKKGETGCFSMLPGFTMAQRTERGSKVLESKYILA